MNRVNRLRNRNTHRAQAEGMNEATRLGLLHMDRLDALGMSRIT